LDPVSPEARSYLAFQLSVTGQLDEAHREYARMLELSPTSPWAHAGIGFALIQHGKFAEAVSAAQDETADWARLVVTAIAQWSLKKNAESDAALEQLVKTGADTAAYQIAEVYAWRGDKDKAFEWLERARSQRDPGVIEMRGDPTLPNLRQDPRWSAFLRTVGLADNQLK
jgi:tetratricopeptide (TPR) repeat protein